VKNSKSITLLIMAAIAGAFFYFIVLKKDKAVEMQVGAERDIPNIILVTLNGVRKSESIEDPTHQYIPHIWNDMKREGVLYTNILDMNKEFHAPSVSAMITGENYEFFANGVNVPSIIQYIRKKHNLPRTKLWTIGNWSYNDRVCEIDPDYTKDTYPCQITTLPIKNSPEAAGIITEKDEVLKKFLIELIRKDPINAPAYALYVHWDSLEPVFYQFFQRIMDKFKPKFLYYMMGAVDSAHYSTYARYALALKSSDVRVFKIWNYVRDDPFYKDNTYLIVCADHERNSYYMQHNENAIDNPSRTWMYIYGPGIKKNIVINRKTYHRDLFPTLAHIMDVDVPESKGKFLKDCFN